MNNRAINDTPDRRTLYGLAGIAGLLGAMVLFVWWPGCRQYPAVTSKESLQLMKLLYTACNTKDPVRLSKVEQGVESAVRAGKMTPAEQDAFAKIIAQAKAGEWTAAEAASFKFARDQVGVGHPAPDDHHHAIEHKKGS